MNVEAPESIGTDSGSNGRPGAVPNHVAVIMDGNGRWAREQGMSRSAGHRAGKENIRVIIEAFAKRGVGCLTLFAFSTENWYRPEDEVQSLIEILGEVIKSEVDLLHRQGIRIRHLGRLDRLKPEIQQAVMDSIRLTSNNNRMMLNVAFDYGGRVEILDAVRRIVADRRNPEEITEELFRGYLYTGETPDPDLVIRTAGEQRLSNFLLWQAAYAEYYSTPVLWPDFDETEVVRALNAYAGRLRRFGRIADPAS